MVLKGFLEDALAIGVSKNLLFRRHSFVFFFTYDFSHFSNSLFFVFNELFFDFFYRGIVNSIFFFFAFDDLFSNYSIMLQKYFFKKTFLDFFLVPSVCFFNRLITYGYRKYALKWLVEVGNFNKLRLRLDKNISYSGLVGFKIHLRGRFSRKQRASSIWYKRGLMSLNTLKASMDYSFSSIPIRNSLISIKV
jgi:hypothetical protein